jgi:hypothetical protein
MKGTVSDIFCQDCLTRKDKPSGIALAPRLKKDIAGAMSFLVAHTLPQVLAELEPQQVING